MLNGDELGKAHRAEVVKLKAWMLGTLYHYL